MRQTIFLLSDNLALAAPMASCSCSGALDGVDSAGEIDQDAVAHQLDDTAMVLGNQRLQESPGGGP